MQIYINETKRFQQTFHSHEVPRTFISKIYLRVYSRIVSKNKIIYYNNFVYINDTNGTCNNMQQ